MTFSYYTVMEFVNVNEVTGCEGMSAILSKLCPWIRLEAIPLAASHWHALVASDSDHRILSPFLNFN